tara:strand:+ start:168 stop:542 length:375 start_codon:yes stop_codon:yes gene_type:complete
LYLEIEKNCLTHHLRSIKLEKIITKNYTDEMVANLVSGYATKEVSNKEFVTEMAQELGKSTKSIVAKLVSLNLYQTEAKVTKAGLPVVSKGVLVGQIEDHFGFTLPSLVKATKVDLQTLVDNLG